MSEGYTNASICLVELGDAVNTASVTMLGLIRLFEWIRCRPIVRQYPRKEKIVKEHKGYARPSRQRLVQRKG